MAVHELRSSRTADWIEYRVQMQDELLRFTFDESKPYLIGDGVTVTSADQCVFIGEVADIDPDRNLAYISIS